MSKNVRLEVVDRLHAAQMVGEDHPEENVLVFTIHDGRQVPRHLFGEATEEVLGLPQARDAYLSERDWGANFLAAEVARELGLGGYLRINVARMLMDYGRFPGSSGPEAPYLKRRAIFPPFHDLLPEEAKHDVLRYYDAISLYLTRHMPSKRVSLAIHTYDRFNATGTERPEISLVSRLMEYQINSTVPPDVFDPLFPPILCETTCHRVLTYRMLNNLEGAGFHAALNYPYVMPVGSLEIRAHVWFFFRHLRQSFEEAFPGTVENPAYDAVWQMLHDVIRRSYRGVLLHDYLHEYRDPPPRERQLFAAARQAYTRVRDYLDENRRRLVDEYRFSPERPSCLGIEVRKDLLCEIDAAAHEVRLRGDAGRVARRIARQIARAVRSYLDSVPAVRMPASVPDTVAV